MLDRIRDRNCPSRLLQLLVEHPDRTAAAMRDSAYLARVDAVRRESINVGVTGIPTFFIGDEVVVGCQPYPVLAAAVEKAGGAESVRWHVEGG